MMPTQQHAKQYEYYRHLKKAFHTLLGTQMLATNHASSEAESSA
jgi:hypothetical protein